MKQFEISYTANGHASLVIMGTAIVQYCTLYTVLYSTVHRPKMI